MFWLYSKGTPPTVRKIDSGSQIRNALESIDRHTSNVSGVQNQQTNRISTNTSVLHALLHYKPEGGRSGI